MDEKIIFKSSINQDNYCKNESPTINIDVAMLIVPKDKLILKQALQDLFLKLLKERKLTIEQLAEIVLRVKDEKLG